MTATDEAWAAQRRQHRIRIANDRLIDAAAERGRAWRALVATGRCFNCLEKPAESGRSGMCHDCDKATKQEYRWSRVTP